MLLKNLSSIGCILVTLSAVPANSAAAPATNARVFKAGAATSNITPELGLGIVGGWNPVPATHIHDELHARCLALDDGTTRLAIVAVDSVGVNREVLDEAKRQVQAATGLRPESMMMSATHTHSAVSARGSNSLEFGKPLDAEQQQLRPGCGLEEIQAVRENSRSSQ